MPVTTTPPKRGLRGCRYHWVREGEHAEADTLYGLRFKAFRMRNVGIYEEQLLVAWHNKFIASKRQPGTPPIAHWQQKYSS